MPRRPALRALLAVLLALGCEPEALDPAPVAPPPTESAPPPPRPRDDGPDDPDDDARPAPPPRPQPDGVPYPLPDPLPPEARPRQVEHAPAPRPGTAPLLFWTGGSGLADGALHYPRALACAGDGSVFVADKSGRIQRFSEDGRLLAVVRTPAVEQGKPTGLRVSPRGELLVADSHYSRVLVYGLDLVLRRTYGAPGPAPGQLMLVTCVHEGRDGLHYLTDYGDTVARVQVLRDDGTFVRTFGTFGSEGPLELQRPMSVWVDDARGELYVADACNHRVVVTTLEGAFVRALGGLGDEPGRLRYPYDVALDADGHVWVAEFGNHRLSVLTREGACLATFGRPGREPGAVNRPWGVAIGAGGRQAWLLDSQLDRLYALDPRALLQGEPAR